MRGEKKDSVAGKLREFGEEHFYIYPVLLLFLGSEMRLAKDETKTSIKN